MSGDSSPVSRSRAPSMEHATTDNKPSTLQKLWNGDGGYRAVRFLGMAAIGAGVLAAVSALTGGNGNPLKVLQEHHDALLVTVALGSAVAAYQLGNMAMDGVRKKYGRDTFLDKEDSFLNVGATGRYRIYKTLAVIAAVVVGLIIANDDSNPLAMVKDSKVALWASLSITCGIVGYQGGNLIAETDFKPLREKISAMGKQIASAIANVSRDIAYREGKVYRIPRIIVLAGFGALALAIANKYLGNGDMNPLEFLKDNHAAFIATIVAGSAIGGYQMGTMAKELYNERQERLGNAPRRRDSVDSLDSEPGIEDYAIHYGNRAWNFMKNLAFTGDTKGFRIGRIILCTVLVAAILAVVGKGVDGNWNPLELLQKHEIAFLATLAGGSAVGGYQLGALAKRMLEDRKQRLAQEQSEPREEDSERPPGTLSRTAPFVRSSSSVTAGGGGL